MLFKVTFMLQGYLFIFAGQASLGHKNVEDISFSRRNKRPEPSRLQHDPK